MKKLTLATTALYVALLGILAIYFGDMTPIIVSGIISPLASAWANGLKDGTVLDAVVNGFAFNWTKKTSVTP